MSARARGTIAIALAAAPRDVGVTAIDGDAKILALAQRKPGAGLVRWQLGLADDLRLATDSADAVVMSLVLHHLSPDAKRRALSEAARVLSPRGRLHIADWGRPAPRYRGRSRPSASSRARCAGTSCRALSSWRVRAVTPRAPSG